MPIVNRGWHVYHLSTPPHLDCLNHHQQNVTPPLHIKISQLYHISAPHHHHHDHENLHTVLKRINPRCTPHVLYTMIQDSYLVSKNAHARIAIRRATQQDMYLGLYTLIAMN